MKKWVPHGHIGALGWLWVPPWCYLYWGESRGLRDYLWVWEPDEDWWWFRFLGLEISISRKDSS